MRVGSERLFQTGDNGYSFLAALMEAARTVPRNLRAKPGSLPLTVLSGFLGSGKTTLVNRLLADPGGRRIIVLVNDFGSLDIDASLIRSRSVDTISLANGCACCTVSSDLTRSLIDVAQMPEPPDAILLEASGAADPRGIAQIALANPALSLAGVITLLDAETFRGYVTDAGVGALLRAQIAAADILALNKVDLVDDGLDATRAAIAQFADGRPIIETTRSNIPADIVFGAHPRSVFHADEPTEAEHSKLFRSWNLVWPEALPEDRVNAVLSAMPEEILRAKGIFCIAGKIAPLVYQRAGRRWSFSDGDQSVARKAGSHLVVIGLTTHADQIERYVADELGAL